MRASWDAAYFQVPFSSVLSSERTKVFHRQKEFLKLTTLRSVQNRLLVIFIAFVGRKRFLRYSFVKTDKTAAVDLSSWKFSSDSLVLLYFQLYTGVDSFTPGKCKCDDKLKFSLM